MGNVCVVSDISQVFLGDIGRIASELRIPVSFPVQLYVAQLLDQFKNSDYLFEPYHGEKKGMSPIAFDIHEQSVEVNKRLADKCLFMVSFFPEKIGRRMGKGAVGYYSGAGKGAYCHLGNHYDSIHKLELSLMYAELGTNFDQLVEVVREFKN